jgi:hypothetical protein
MASLRARFWRCSGRSRTREGGGDACCLPSVPVNSLAFDESSARGQDDPVCFVAPYCALLCQAEGTAPPVLECSFAAGKREYNVSDEESSPHCCIARLARLLHV